MKSMLFHMIQNTKFTILYISDPSTPSSRVDTNYRLKVAWHNTTNEVNYVNGLASPRTDAFSEIRVI